MDLAIILQRFIITFILALVFGIDRQLSHKPTGFGTYTFVAIGSCALAILATLLNHDNPLPLLSATITGIGFLGAGALIKTPDRIYGFTSAASIWLFSILGLVVGNGRYMVALIVYILVWAIIVIDKHLEKNHLGYYQRKVFITATRHIPKREFLDLLGAKKVSIFNISVDKKDNTYNLALLVEGARQETNEMPQKLLSCDDITSFRIE